MPPCYECRSPPPNGNAATNSAAGQVASHVAAAAMAAALAANGGGGLPADQAPHADSRAPRESPLPEEEQAKAVAALAAAAAAREAAAAAAAAAPLLTVAAAKAGAAAEAAAAPAARVPARALYGLAVDEADGAAAAQGQAQGQAAAEPVGRPAEEARLPLLPRMEDDGRLPAYALAGGEPGWQPDAGRGGRKGDRGEEEPPPGCEPTDLFIGAVCAGGRRCSVQALWGIREHGCISSIPSISPLHRRAPPLFPPGGLPPSADEMGVWEAVVPAGEVVGVRLIRRKRDRGDCRGYGTRLRGGRRGLGLGVALGGAGQGRRRWQHAHWRTLSIVLCCVSCLPCAPPSPPIPCLQALCAWPAARPPTAPARP